jgi:hypothetical protein
MIRKILVQLGLQMGQNLLSEVITRGGARVLKSILGSSDKEDDFKSIDKFLQHIFPGEDIVPLVSMLSLPDGGKFDQQRKIMTNMALGANIAETNPLALAALACEDEGGRTISTREAVETAVAAYMQSADTTYEGLFPMSTSDDAAATKVSKVGSVLKQLASFTPVGMAYNAYKAYHVDMSEDSLFDALSGVKAVEKIGRLINLLQFVAAEFSDNDASFSLALKKFREGDVFVAANMVVDLLHKYYNDVYMTVTSNYDLSNDILDVEGVLRRARFSGPQAFTTLLDNEKRRDRARTIDPSPEQFAMHLRNVSRY